MRELYPDLDMGFQGSSVTGRSADTGRPFDEGRVSDYDIAISGDSVNEAARANGVPFRGDEVSTGPLTERDLDRLGLDDIVSDASAAAGRDVHVMVFRTMDDAVGRKPTIRVWF
jgi:filamentous hemagglutinin